MLSTSSSLERNYLLGICSRFFRKFSNTKTQNLYITSCKFLLQIEFVLQEKPQLKESKDWKELYASLRRKYGLREEFTEMIMLCRKCCALFWKSLGHPCFVLAEEIEANEAAASSLQTVEVEGNNKKGCGGNTNSDQLIPVSPKSFLTFFSV